MNHIYYQSEIQGFGDYSPFLESVGANGCLAMCYLWAVGIEPLNSSQMAKYIHNAMKAGLLDSDCFVTDAQNYLRHFTGRVFNVTKKTITSIDRIKNPTPVRYDYNGKSHWVVVENGKIIFNSLVNSQCVSKGKPVTAREITLV